MRSLSVIPKRIRAKIRSSVVRRPSCLGTMELFAGNNELNAFTKRWEQVQESFIKGIIKRFDFLFDNDGRFQCFK